MKNRLQLDWNIELRPDRNKFITDYLNNCGFEPNPEELEKMANYILWGKNPTTGLNGRQEGLELETRYKTWDASPVESLDALMESPSFSEAMLHGLHEPPTKLPRQVFSRTEARTYAPHHIKLQFEDLWKAIDTFEYLITKYELNHNKRTLPIRQELLDELVTEGLDFKDLDATAASLSEYQYLRKKHRLVELRSQQYTLRESYITHIPSMSTFNTHGGNKCHFGIEISIAPFNYVGKGKLFGKIFREDRYPNPNDFTQDEIKQIVKLLWQKNPYQEKQGRIMDLGNPDVLYEIFDMWEELVDGAARNQELGNNESTLGGFLGIVKCYRALSKLEGYLNDILDMKIEHRSNQWIADRINEKYGKNYKPNYISTLYCKKCLASIAAVALQHREVLENLTFPNEFKKCKDCGEVFLICDLNFVKRARSNDGYSPRCKRCEKLLRVGGKKK